MSKKPERVSNLYKQNSQLHWLSTRTQQLGKLNIILQNCLPLKFSQHCHLANVTNDEIILHTDNASYASMIRFQAPMICRALSAHLPHPIGKLEIKVRPNLSIAAQDTHTSIKLTNKSAALIKDTADSLEDGPLKVALKKLASRQTN